MKLITTVLLCGFLATPAFGNRLVGTAGLTQIETSLSKIAYIKLGAFNKVPDDYFQKAGLDEKQIEAFNKLTDWQPHAISRIRHLYHKSLIDSPDDHRDALLGRVNEQFESIGRIRHELIKYIGKIDNSELQALLTLLELED